LCVPEYSLCEKSRYFRCKIINNKFWQELISYFHLIRHEPHRKRRVQQFFYCCVCIRCRRNGFKELMPSNDRGWTCRQRQMWRTYEVRRWDSLRCHGIRTKFQRDWFNHSNVYSVDTQTHRQHGDCMNLLLFLENKEGRQIK
jgi:hypothetical protein